MAVLLLFSPLVALSAAHALPPKTSTIDFRILNVEAWPPRPTQPPISLEELRKRQDFNTICGFIGGNALLPATCEPGSHCVLDREHGAVGCCPNGGPCTTGVFTGCVDFNSGPQSVKDPYVFTCQGADVCYQNQFDGGFSQFGCGTASSLATVVRTAASGLTTPLALSTLSVPLTESRLSTSFTFSATRTTTKSGSTASSTATTTTRPSTTGATTGTTTAPTTTSTTDAGAAGAGGGIDRTGAIAGGTISGVAILVALIAVGVYLYKRRGNRRQGPGLNGDSQYLSPMNQHGFQQLATSNGHYESGLPLNMYNQTGGNPASATSAMAVGQAGYGAPYQPRPFGNQTVISSAAGSPPQSSGGGLGPAPPLSHHPVWLGAGAGAGGEALAPGPWTGPVRGPTGAPQIMGDPATVPLTVETGAAGGTDAFGQYRQEWVDNAALRSIGEEEEPEDDIGAGRYGGGNGPAGAVGALGRPSTGGNSSTTGLLAAAQHQRSASLGGTASGAGSAVSSGTLAGSGSGNGGNGYGPGPSTAGSGTTAEGGGAPPLPGSGDLGDPDGRPLWQQGRNQGPGLMWR